MKNLKKLTVGMLMAISVFANMELAPIHANSNYQPGNTLTRAEFVEEINSAFEYTEKGQENFIDVDESHKYYDEICKAVGAGYIDGKSGGMFDPDDEITRQEVAKILITVLNNEGYEGYDIDEYKELNKLKTFKDGLESTDDWAKPYVEAAIEKGYLRGYSDNTIKANQDITRAEALSTMYRVYKNIK